MISANVLVTMNVQAQLKAVATEAADPRIFPGKISPIINLFSNILKSINVSQNYKKYLPWNRSKSKTETDDKDDEGSQRQPSDV